MERKLTPRQKAFAEEYVMNGYNATQAYLKAYNCSEKTARACCVDNLKRQNVKDYIWALQKQAFEANCINAERVALKLAEIAFSSKGDEYYNSNAQLKALDLLQKQLGLQTQKLEADVKNDIVINIGE